MAGCGYVCPVCEGTGLDENSKVCEYCSKEESQDSKDDESRKEWLKNVHEGPCCGDWEES